MDPLIADPAFPTLKALAIDLTGMAYYAEKDDALAAALGRRMAARGVARGDVYAAMLEGGGSAEEREALVVELTIGETYFFRYQAQWSALTELVLPDLFARNRPLRRLSLWSAGCSIGAEPYTAAILLRDRFAREAEGWDVRILGTDINRTSLATARAARYTPWAFRATPDAVRDRCFAADGHLWELRPEYRKGVVFEPHNLIRDPIPPDRERQPDLILCRNVFIYFDAATNRRLAEAFHDALPEGGWLLVGHAEANAALFERFRSVMLPDSTIYQKSSDPDERPRRRTTVAPAPHPVPARPVPARPAPAHPTFPRRPLPHPAPPAAIPKPAAEPVTAAPDPGADIRAMIAHEAWQAATAACLRWLEAEPLDPLAYLHLGLLFEQRGNPARAVGAYRRALYLERGLLFAHYQLGCLLRPRDRRAALRHFHTLLGLSAVHAPDGTVAGIGGMTVADLRQATRTQIAALETTP
ncbi:protein-glutamate O-methyltransferase CheR [Azospirillum sp. RWY-5-1]|uniref:protein-glutamate O-methyltransferase n=1 Tax=Azospirillum oleiclasticum TaxID=2735135 RepID=A0ABX2TLP9_9PROT|nr:CheR family methyltransferase [Azospirillum oleiclasticum]NYZ15936.1 protein-glutamate O-methyltransferase CheR [Azospirillum oleiclasticum]NYZ23585.1 protein-glutamate O-methyltransferase CheR [Azospirillum oleiclasticum]